MVVWEFFLVILKEQFLILDNFISMDNDWLWKYSVPFISYLLTHEYAIFVLVKVSQMQQTVVIETRQTTEVNQSSLILDFDRSVAELRDWLTLLERMLKSQRVTVGDISDIEQTIMKQKVYIPEMLCSW